MPRIVAKGALFLSTALVILALGLLADCRKQRISRKEAIQLVRNKGIEENKELFGWDDLSVKVTEDGPLDKVELFINWPQSKLPRIQCYLNA